jgi:protein TonB
VIALLTAAVILVASLAGTSLAAQPQEQSSSSTLEQADHPPQRVRVSTGVANALLLRKVNPKYPKDARKQHIQGTVSLRVQISKDGDVVNTQVMSGDSALTDAAIDAVKQWKFKPYLLNGHAVEVDTQLLINFTLSGG